MKKIRINVEVEVEEKNAKILQDTLDKYYGGATLKDWIKETIELMIEKDKLFEAH